MKNLINFYGFSMDMIDKIFEILSNKKMEKLSIFHFISLNQMICVWFFFLYSAI